MNQIFSDLESKINENTKGIIINSPSNPTGGVWSDEAIKKTLEISHKNDLWVFSDECYEQLVYDMNFKSIATFTNDRDKVLTFQSCSKTYAMTGWRIGYTIGNQDVVKAMGKLQGQSTSCPNSIAQYAAVEALIGNQDIISNMVTKFKTRRDLILDGLTSVDNILCDTPKGAFYVFPDVSHYINKSYKDKVIKSANDLSMILLEEKYIVTVSGESFGAPNNIRFSYATSEDVIHKMLDRFKTILSLVK